jgi:hypothetical protein
MKLEVNPEGKPETATAVKPNSVNAVRDGWGGRECRPWWVVGGHERLLDQQGSGASLRSPRRLGAGCGGWACPARTRRSQACGERGGTLAVRLAGWIGGVWCCFRCGVVKERAAPGEPDDMDGTRWRRTGEISPRPVATTAEEHGRGAAMSQMAARSWCRCRPTPDPHSTGRRRASNRHATHRSARIQRVPDTGAQLARRRSLQEGGPPYGRVAAPMQTGQRSLGREPRQALNRAPPRYRPPLGR